ncbi:MAG: hypothetical protein ABIH36_02950 [bacterium]
MTQRLFILLLILIILIGAISYTSRDKLSQLWLNTVAISLDNSDNHQPAF